MIKKYLPDILCLIVVVIIAFLATPKAAIDPNVRPSTNVKKQLQDVKKEEKGRVQKEIVEEVVTLGALKERNIFSPYGNYAISGAVLKGPLPEKPYTLIGILEGEEKKAVFRDYTGSIITLAVGKQLIDGSVITRIDRLSVVVERGDEKKELKVFDLTDPARRAPPKPEISKARSASRPEAPPRGERGSRERKPDQGTSQRTGQTPRQRR